MEHVPYGLIRTHEAIYREQNGCMFTMDHRIFITTPQNEVFYTLVGDLQFVLYRRVPLLKRRILPACACNGSLAIIHGGYCQHTREVLDDLIVFDGSEFKSLPPSGLPLREHALVFLDGRRLLLFGGRTILTSLSSDTLVYSISTSQWLPIVFEPGSQRPIARYGHTLTPRDERIFLYGGTTGKKALSDLWEFVWHPDGEGIQCAWRAIPLSLGLGWALPSLPGLHLHVTLPCYSYLLIFSGIGNMAGCFFLIDPDEGIVWHSTRRFPLNLLTVPACIFQDFVVTPTLCIHVDNIEFTEPGLLAAPHPPLAQTFPDPLGDVPYEG
ncbi:Kelch motif-containing protein [Giardia muris]|uniref:Kelch motif-containing protein n=1 Tax=Giardia muris TaxID=5742 RepID=A0A4Z1T4W4_GIAMU|nr:Kelch motif-containing protein [Giardia muris]|eukprot:TNJ29043.1 Kelch motif-containing protein [Giardia muris]